MTDPAGNDRIQQDVPTTSGEVPVTREDAVERDSAHDDDQPARPGTSDVGLLDRADPDGSA